MLAFLWALVSTAAGPARVVKPVSLHAISATSVGIDWETDQPVAVSVALTGPKAPAEGTGKPATHHLVAVQGLQPGTQYRYECRAGVDVMARGAFWTAPARDDKAPFTFAVVGDARNHAQWARTAAAILEKGPRFLVDTGDSVNRGDGADWRDYYTAAQTLFAQMPVFATRGNHDGPDGYAEYNPWPPGGLGPSAYAFTYGNAAFVTLDSNFPDDARQRTYVERALGALTGGPLFVFQHHPLFSCGRHGSSPELQEAYKPLFERYRVTADFAGHDHDLIEWLPLGGVRYVVSGGGGTSAYSLSGCEGLPFAKEGYGFVIVKVEGAAVSMTFFDERGIEVHQSAPLRAAGAIVPNADLLLLRGNH
jgi:hypothetical protein